MDPKVLFLLFMFLIESHGEIIDVIDYRQQTLDELLKDRQATLTLAGKVSDPFKKGKLFIYYIMYFFIQNSGQSPNPQGYSRIYI